MHRKEGENVVIDTPDGQEIIVPNTEYEALGEHGAIAKYWRMQQTG